MKRTAILNVVGLSSALIGSHTPHIRNFLEKGFHTIIKPAFPAVTCTAQADYLTGVRPNEHGIVANGWYDRDYAEHFFWNQSNHLVTHKKLWEELRETHPDFTCAKLFWWFNMYSSADYSITPRPIYLADGGKVFDIYTSPAPIRFEIQKELGDFPFMNFWGPFADIKSSRWIAQASQWIEEKYSPHLSLIYLPHLDYNLQRLGPSYSDINKDLGEIDQVIGELITFFEKNSVQVILLSEYGIVSVNKPIHLNRLFREQGWLALKKDLDLEYLDKGASQTFALTDHQIAHVYINNSEIKDKVRACLLEHEDIEIVLDSQEIADCGMNHKRSGDLIAVAKSYAWFTYYYWENDQFAPDFARAIDIHRKIGYDPAELFINPSIGLPKLKVAYFLLRRTLGMRGLLNIVPLDASLVKGSHGAIPQQKSDFPLFISQNEFSQVGKDYLVSTEVYAIVKELIES
ncbi:MAG: nucleotide pyrophosphatase/phosphodiesterase family protein [Verrucomicrobiota bacterium]